MSKDKSLENVAKLLAHKCVTGKCSASARAERRGIVKGLRMAANRLVREIGFVNYNAEWMRGRAREIVKGER